MLFFFLSTFWLCLLLLLLHPHQARHAPSPPVLGPPPPVAVPLFRLRRWPRPRPPLLGVAPFRSVVRAGLVPERGRGFPPESPPPRSPLCWCPVPPLPRPSPRLLCRVAPPPRRVRGIVLPTPLSRRCCWQAPSPPPPPRRGRRPLGDLPLPPKCLGTRGLARTVCTLPPRGKPRRQGGVPAPRPPLFLEAPPPPPPP